MRISIPEVDFNFELVELLKLVKSSNPRPFLDFIVGFFDKKFFLDEEGFLDISMDTAFVSEFLCIIEVCPFLEIFPVVTNSLLTIQGCWFMENTKG